MTTIADLQLIYFRKALARNLHDRRDCPADAALYIAAAVEIEHNIDTEKLNPLDLEIIAEALSQEYARTAAEAYQLALIFGNLPELGLGHLMTEEGDPAHMEIADYVLDHTGKLVLDEESVAVLTQIKTLPEAAPLIAELKAAQPEVFALCELFGVKD